MGASAANAAGDPVSALREHLKTPNDQRQPLPELAESPLSKRQAVAAERMLWRDHAQRIGRERAEEMRQGIVAHGGFKMRFTYQEFGKKPKDGRSLYFSLHGGGGAAARVNDQQWRNQQRLYQPAEGVYLAPRAPTDKWNLWHLPHIDPLLDRLIENLVVLADVNPNKVYVMGYSAGGDGVYQLGPRMADRWAAAAMMAGHPNDASPLGLRNIGFAIYMGGRDAAYQRNKIAAQWKGKLDELQVSDPDGYRHLVTIYPEKGHWMDREDASALGWMRQQTRNPLPKTVVWKQDNVTHRRFYWLAVDEPKAGSLVRAKIEGQTIDIQATGVDAMAIRLNDAMLDLDRPVRITTGDKVVFEGVAPRRVAVLAKTLAERGDPAAVFSAEVSVRLGADD